ncbi:MAG: hypothetical protein H6591_06035 [Flavobacteriales bacterium]|nr:hypothetical protein [Flavobacteriales bacterium]
MKNIVIAIALVWGAAAFAQSGTTKEGYALQWDKTITVLPDSISNGHYKLPAWTFAVHEADASDVMGWWLADMQAVSTSVAKAKPAKALGTRIAAVPDAAIAVAAATSDKKAKLAKLTIAFALNDSVTTPGNAGQEDYVRALAVKYNRAVVDQQIATYEKMLDKAGDKLAGAKDDVAKNQANLTKSNSKLEKIKAKRGKIQAENAHVAGTIAGLEKKFALSNDPKDLQKLTKARQKLAKGETSLAKLMQQEADVQGDIAKEQGRLEDNTGEQEERGATKEEVQRVTDALKRKHDAIN